MQQIWKEILNLSDVGLGEDFFELGGESLLVIRLISACNAAFGVTLPLTALFTNRTVESLAAAVRRDYTGSCSARLIKLRPSNSENAPLICLHPQGGTIFCYEPLIAGLPIDLPVFGLQAAGLDADEEVIASVGEMATDYIRHLQAHWPHGPYRLLGYSFGGLIAYEIASQLEAMGETISKLSIYGYLEARRIPSAGIDR